MKKLLLTGAMLFALAGAVFAQGHFALNNGAESNGISLMTPGNWYSGTYSVEIWLYASAGTAASSVISQIATYDYQSSTGGAVKAYNYMQSMFGFSAPEETVVGQVITAANEGILSYGPAISMADDPNGGLVTVALAAWNNTQSSWANMMANATLATRAGVTAFNQPTTIGINGVPAIQNWNTYDLVLGTVPEPGTFALAGLGAAVLVIFRRRK